MTKPTSFKTKRAASVTRALLVGTFPRCFAPNGASKLPIAVGIHQEIMAALPEIGFRRLYEALADYTSGPTYLSNVVEGAPRIGLDGQAKGFVTAPEAKHAACRLAGFEGWAKAQAPSEKAEAA